MQDKCKRAQVKNIEKDGEKEFKFETVFNTDGTVRGYVCQFQKFV